MDLLSTTEHVTVIEQRAKKLGLSISEICRRARVDRSTFQRWKSGETDPLLSVLNKIYEVIATAEAEVKAR